MNTTVLQKWLQLGYDTVKMHHKGGRKLDIKELVDKYNQILQSGMNSQEFTDSVSMARKTLQQKLRRAGYVFNKDWDMYVLKDGAEIKEIKSTDTVKSEPKKTNKQDLSEVLQQLKKLSERVEKLENSRTSVEVASTQEEGIGLVLRAFDTPVKQISYRYHTEVLDAWDKLCRKYPNYTKHAIINSLLLDALERVNK